MTAKGGYAGSWLGSCSTRLWVLFVVILHRFVCLPGLTGGLNGFPVYERCRIRFYGVRRLMKVRLRLRMKVLSLVFLLSTLRMM